MIFPSRLGVEDVHDTFEGDECIFPFEQPEMSKVVESDESWTLHLL